MFLELQKEVEIHLTENNFQIMNARITFRNIPLHKLANFSLKDVAAACKSFIENADASECLIIQTSSRIEVFTVGGIQTGEIPDARRNFDTDGTPAKNQGKRLDVSKILSTWSSLAETVSYTHLTLPTILLV